MTVTVIDLERLKADNDDNLRTLKFKLSVREHVQSKFLDVWKYCNEYVEVTVYCANCTLCL